MTPEIEFPTLEEFELYLVCADFWGFKIYENWGWTGCPIWSFLTLRGLTPTIYRDGTWHPESQVEYVDGFKMPAWAAEFVWLIDLYKPRRLTNADCLKLLENPLYRPEYWLSGKIRHPIRSLED